MELGAVGGGQPHVLVVEAEAVGVEGDVVRDARDPGDVDLRVGEVEGLLLFVCCCGGGGVVGGGRKRKGGKEFVE